MWRYRRLIFRAEYRRSFFSPCFHWRKPHKVKLNRRLFFFAAEPTKAGTLCRSILLSRFDLELWTLWTRKKGVGARKISPELRKLSGIVNKFTGNVLQRRVKQIILLFCSNFHLTLRETPQIVLSQRRVSLQRTTVQKHFSEKRISTQQGGKASQVSDCTQRC